MATAQLKIIELDEGWEIMQKGITKMKKILEGQQHSFSSEDSIMLYTTVYNMCSQKPPNDYAQQLYDKYKEVFEEYINSTVLPALREKHDELMLMEFVKRWANHKLMVRWLSRFFRYLDRYFISRRSLPTLNEVGLTCFRDLVYKELNSKARDAVIVLIDQEREGEQIDRALLKNVLDIFVEIGMGEMGYYENDFEDAMLKDTAAYYSRKASSWSVEDSCPDYMLKAEECLKKEKDRASHYLCVSSETKLLEKVQNELLVVYTNQLLEKEYSRCRALLTDDKVEDLSRVFRLSHIIPKGLELVSNMFKQHVIAEGVDLVQEVEDATNSLVLVQQADDTTNSPVLVQQADDTTNSKILLPTIGAKLADMEDVERIPASAEPPTELTYPSVDEELVGFDDHANTIIAKLMLGPRNWDVVSIVGMAGMGKTALARMVYNNVSIIDHFDVRAWCFIGQIYKDVRKLFLEILRQTTGDRYLNVDDPDDMLRRNLLGRRYLIVLDDICESDLWDDLARCFRSVERGSRIMVTTRNVELTRYMRRYTDPYLLPSLRDEESWELLQKKVFQGESCPLELRSVGPLVAKKCNGLPFLIIMIAAILSRKKREASLWLEVAYDIGSYTLEEGSMKMILSSYDLLPNYLKTSLLYMVLFPNDYAQQLYDKYKEVFEDYINSTVLPALREKHDELMLMEFVKRWANHKLMVKWLSQFFHYLDQHLIARKSLPTLNEVGLTCFRDLVYQELNGKARDAVIVLIDQEREGEQIDRALLKNVLDIFVEIGMGEMGYYENDFEDAMLKDTAAYYSWKASSWIVEDSCPDYILKAKECLKKEKDRVSHYLHVSSETKLLEKVQNELLVVYTNQLLEKEHSGCRALLTDDKLEDLSRVFRLSYITPNGLEPVSNMFKQHVIAEGVDLVQEAEDATNSSVLVQQADDTTNSPVLVQQAEDTTNSPVLVQQAEDTTNSKILLPKIVKGAKLADEKEVERIPAFAEPPTKLSYPSVDEELVGFDDHAKNIFVKLTSRRKDLDVISIVGMAGIGKTALARKVYSDVSIIDHFEVRAWCSVGQIYSVRKLFLEILRQIRGDRYLNVDDPASMLRWNLLGKRYLIVLDDICESESWDVLTRCFLSVERRSRIMVTTRNAELAQYMTQHSDPYFLPFIRYEESWELLEKKVFQGESCPLELRSVGTLVAKKCKGLPYLIIMIAGILSRKKRDASTWLEVAYDIGSHTLEEGSMKMIQSSYDLLPDYLKPCLLYMGLFSKDYEIRVSDLLKWWIAEEFVPNIGTLELEETSMSCLSDLVSRNMVVVSKTRVNGEMKCCIILDQVREFCLTKIKEEKFMQHVGKRLCMYIHDGMTSDFKERESFGISQASLEFIAHPKFSISDNKNLFPLLNNLRLIRVLHLLDFYLDDSWAAAFQLLTHLRYLAIFVKVFHIKWVSHLVHLQTLGVRSSYIMVSPAIWKLEKLRHVDINEFPIRWEDGERVKFKESTDIVLHNLKTLGTCSMSLADMTPKFWNKFPNLEQLRLHIDEFGDVPYYSGSRLMTLDMFPTRLRKLSLSETFLTDEIVSSIAKLQHLETLKLSEIYFTGEKHWDLGDNTFKVLRVLKLHRVFMTQWYCSDAYESFPSLEYLVIKSCSKLEEIPLSFADVPTLRLIKVTDCSKSVGDSALKIEKEMEEYGCELQVHILKND